MIPKKMQSVPDHLKNPFSSGTVRTADEIRMLSERYGDGNGKISDFSRWEFEQGHTDIGD